MAASQLLAALNALYHHDDPKMKDEADRWLEQWQQSVDAWSVADGVLHDPSSSMEAQYFCAQTLRTKVQRDFEELPQEAVDSLRDSLLQLLIHFSKGAPPVRTQLCLALAALAVHVPAERWGEGGVVRWFAVKFSPLPPDLALPCMLELLTVLPQEVHSYKIAVRPERRRAFSGELQANTGAAFEILTSCLSQPGERTRTQVLEAFGSWLKLNEGRPLPSIAAAAAAASGSAGTGEDAASVLARHRLVEASLEGLQSTGETFHAAVDAICEVIWTTVDFNIPSSAGSSDPSSGSPNGGGSGNGPPTLSRAALPLVQAIVPAIMGLRGRFSVAAGRGGSGAREGEFDDEDSAKGMARLFCEVGEAYMSLIIEAVPAVRAPVEALLEVVAYPDFGICSMSFNFWHRLSRQLVNGLSSGGTNSSADEAAERERRRQFFQPAFERLVQLIRGRVRENESYATLSKDEKHEFRSSRDEVGDTLDDAAAVLGFSRCLSLLVEPLAALGAPPPPPPPPQQGRAAANGGSASGDASGRGYDWRTAEAALFCIKSIHRHATSPGDASLQQLLEVLPGLPREFPQLQATVCSTIARYGRWLERSMQAGYCRPLLQRLLGLAVADLELPNGYCQPAAASAIRHLCEECGAFMGSCLQDLLGLYNKVLRMGAAAGAPLGANGTSTTEQSLLMEEDVELIIAAVCQAVSQAAPPDQRSQAGVALLMPVLQQLRDALTALGPSPPPPGSGVPPPAPVATSNPHLNPLVDRLAEVFGRTADSEVVAQMLMASWPVLDALMLRCAGCPKTTEHVLRTLRYGIKGAGRSAAQLLPTLLEVLPARFTATRHSAFLFIVSELVKFFGDDTSHDNTLSLILAGLITEAGRPLTSLATLTSSPDMVDDLFLLGLRALGYAPRLLLAPPGPLGTECRALVTLLDVAMIGCVIQHREANGSVLSFIARLTAPVTLARCPAAAADVLRLHLLPRAPIFVRLLLSCIAGSLPPGRVGIVSAALIGLVAFGATGPGAGAGTDMASSQGLGWLTAALQVVPEVAATSSDKQALLGAATAALRAGPPVSGSGEGDMMGNGDGGGYYDDSGWEAACQEFADLCRRNKRARQAAQAALLPQELAAAVDNGERRRGG